MRRLLLLLSLCSFSFARSVISGNCEAGAQQVSTQGVQSSTYVQRSYPSCTVNVYLTGTLTHATIYNTFGGVSKTNPFVADNTGYWFFWVDEGQYDVVLSGGQIVGTLTRYAGVGAAVSGSLLAANNLSDVQSVVTSRNNLGLGGAALLNVGTASSTVAAGDDSRFPTAGQKLALAGTSGTPGLGNEYVTRADAATTSTNNLIPRANGAGKLAANWLDYTGQYATTSQPGFLSAADWNTFSAKQAAGSYITSLTGDATASGPGAASVTIARAVADGATVGLAAFAAADFNSSAGVISLDYTNAQAADGSHKGYLTAADWTTFNNKQAAGSYVLGGASLSTTGAIPYQVSSGTITSNGTNLTLTIPSYTILTVGSAANSAVLAANSAAGFQASTIYYDNATEKWQFGKQTDNSFFLYDAANARDAFRVVSGVVYLNPIAGNVKIGGSIQFIGGGYGAGILFSDSSGNITSVTDAKISALTGDVTATGPGSVAATIAANAVTLAKMAQVATGVVLGRNTAGIGNVEALTTLPSAVAVPYASLTGVPASPDILNSVCTGTATASSTLYIIQYGLAACTNTAETILAGAEILVQRNGTIKNLRARSGAAGSAGGSGVITLSLVSTGDTIVTCTIGTGTTCSDTTHSASVTAGDRIYIKMVTAAAETLANILVTYEY